MSGTRSATVTFRGVVPKETVKLNPQIRMTSQEPTVISITGGIMAVGNVAKICDDIEGNIGLCAIATDDDHFVNFQIDVAHPHENLRVAGAFVLAIDDATRVAEAMMGIVQLAKLERDAAGG